jgi:hypothetical protein
MALQDIDVSTYRRPLAVTIICVVMGLGSLVVIPFFFSGFVWKIGTWYPPYLAASAVLGFVCMLGLWKMRRWAALVYAAATAINQLLLILTGLWTTFALLPVVATVVMLLYLGKMR